jgi:hypothetical protein
MTKPFDLETFKATLEKYMVSTQRLCSKNRDFFNHYKKVIPKNFILMEGQPIPGRGHYWWSLDGKIYDSTIHQFTKANCGNCDQNLSDYFKNFPDVQDAFSKIYEQYNYYDENYNCYDEIPNTGTSINRTLVKWYNEIPRAQKHKDV